MLGNKDAVATVAVRNLDAARKFYEGTLGLKVVGTEGDEVIAFRSGASTLFVYRSQYAGTNRATAVTWVVGDEVDAIARALKAKGVAFEHYDHAGHEARGRRPRRRRRQGRVVQGSRRQHPQHRQRMSKAGRREWIGLAVIALPCLLYSMDLTVLNLAVPSLSADLKPSAAAAALDRRHLRLPGRRVADHDGHARRPHRPPQAADDRRGGVRRRLGARRVLDQRRDADRVARAARRRRRDARAVDAVADPQHVPRPARSARSRSASGSRATRPARRSARWSAACCSSTSGGARCS